MIDDCSFLQPLLQSIRARKIRPHVFERRLAFVTQNELDFAKLNRLKTGRSLEPIPETRKRGRRHRFENDAVLVFEFPGSAPDFARFSIDSISSPSPKITNEDPGLHANITPPT